MNRIFGPFAWRSLAALGLFGCSSIAALAAPVIDPVGDFLSTYTGPAGGDLDVTFTDVRFNGRLFEFVGTMNAAIGTTPSTAAAPILYVWGLDRGAGTPRFVAGSPSIGAGVLFDSVVLLRPDGSGNFNDLIDATRSFALPAGSVSITGATITGVVDATRVLSRSFTQDNFTYNLWPRAGAGNNAQVSDFAPNASNSVVTRIPEPPTLALLALFVLLPGAPRLRRLLRGAATVFRSDVNPIFSPPPR